MDGILNIDKPYGITSMDVVRRIKRASGLKRVGHGGTLDPVASGVLPVCFGQATRVMEHLVGGTKDYRAAIELGVSTDTYDALGKVTGRGDLPNLTSADVERALEPFKGVTQQVPPMYSALKRQGKRLYELARAGIEVEREPRRVETHKIEVLEWSPPLVTLEVRCGRGFYMRSLAHDLGEALGCGAHLKSLVRLRSGPFEISNALPLAEAERALTEDGWRDIVYAPDVVYYGLRAAIVGKRLEELIRHGRPLPVRLGFPISRPDEQCRVYGVEGAFIGLITFDASEGQWRPDKVFSLDHFFQDERVAAPLS